MLGAKLNIALAETEECGSEMYNDIRCGQTVAACFVIAISESSEIYITMFTCRSNVDRSYAS